MKDAKLLREFIQEAIRASASYMKKEEVREMIESEIIERLKTHKIGNEAELDDFFDSAEMAIRALKMVPFENWVILSSRRR